ncbi:AMP-binding protein [Bradyrhizobium murdochi]|uniref:AMP-binding protein n=1 Tax=Bradyrhizobium murdochi TaxID=1038859 RepID=UPI0018DEACF3|nr:AMP-binding protein [Bradyrhizobium murdochi]
MADGRTVVTHLLARSRMLLGPGAYRFLRSFDLPREISAELLDADADRTSMDVEARWFSDLRSSLLLRPSGNEEAERIQRVYRIALWRQDAYASVLSSLAGSLTFDRSSVAWRKIDDEVTVSESTLLKLSACLAKLDLPDGGMLATHPLGSPVEMEGALWNLASAFDGSKTVGEIAETFGQDSEVVSAVARFLLVKRLAFENSLMEVKLADEIGGRSLDECKTIYPAENRWRQRYQPYQLDLLAQVKALLRVATIGPCQMQLHAEALESVGHQAGLCLTVTSMLQPGPELQEKNWAAVICSAASFMARFLEATWASPSRVRQCIPELLARVDNLIFEIRQHTNAPVLLLGLSRSGLSNDSSWTEISAAIAEGNQQLARYMSDRDGVVLIDQEEITARSGGAYWDDLYTASPHHSAISSWSWVVMKPHVTDQSIDKDSIPSSPPVAPGQADPAGTLAEKVVRLILGLHARPIKLLFVDPDDLLWPGTLIARPHPLGRIPHYFADVEQYLYSGIHEALSIIRRRGVKLVLATETPRSRLEQLWRIDVPVENVVRFTDVSNIVNPRSLDAVATTLDRLGVAPEEALWLSRSRPKPMSRMHAYRGDIWHIRSFLLDNPLLMSPERPDLVREMPAEAVRSASPNQTSVSDALNTLIARSLGCSTTKLTDASDLRNLGLDSIGAVNLLNNIEEHFGIELEDADFTEAVAFNGEALLGSVVRAVNRLSQVPRYVTEVNGLEAKEASSLGEFVRHALVSSRQEWLFKILRSNDMGDCDYLSPRTLLQRVEQSAAWLRNEGLKPGDILAIQTEDLSLQIEMLLASLIADILPVVMAPPRVLDASTLAEWTCSFSSLTRTAALFSDNEKVTRALAWVRPHLKLLPAASARNCHQGIYLKPSNTDVDAPAIALRSSGSASHGHTFIHSHRAILTGLRELAERLKLTQNDVIVNFVPIHHSMGLLNTVLLPLLAGARVVTMNRSIFATAPYTFLREATKERATCAFVNNAALTHLVRAAKPRLLREIDLRHFRLIVAAGEPVTALVFQKFATMYESVGLRRGALSSGYGMAEAGGPIAHGAPGHPPKALSGSDTITTHGNLPAASEILSSGRPLPSVQIRIVTESGSIAQDGEIGRIFVRAPGIALNIDRTSEAGVVTPDGFLDTGDLGSMNKEEVFVIGRRDDTILVSGVNNYPAIIEAAASKVLPDTVEAALCFGEWDAEGGTARLVLGVECQGGQLTAENEMRIREYLLIHCGVVVKSIRAYKIGTFLRTPSGKLSRSATLGRLGHSS